LAFLVLIGAFLIAEGFDVHIAKGFIYGPMAFAIAVEALNLTYKRRQQRREGATATPVALRPAFVKGNHAEVAAAAAVDRRAVSLSRRPVSPAVARQREFDAHDD